MAETIFPVLPERKRAKGIQLAIFGGFGLLALALAVVGPWGWIGWLVGGVLLGLAAGKAISLFRMRFVARVDDVGVTVCLPIGREITVRWQSLEAHTITPGSNMGGLVAKAGDKGQVRLVPVATRDMGDEATEELLALIKARLPKIEYRLPTVGRG